MASMNATVDLVREQRAKIDPVRLVLTILAALFFAPGWVARKTVIAVWWAVSYAAAAVMVGWRAGAPPERST